MSEIRKGIGRFCPFLFPNFPGAAPPGPPLGFGASRLTRGGVSRLHPRRCAATPPAAARRRGMLVSIILVRSKAATSITIPYIVVHTPDLRSPSPVRVRGCRLVVARLRRLTRPRAPCNGHPSPLPGVAWRSAPLNVQTWANRGSSARWAAARGSLRSSRRALTRWAIGSRARPSSAVHSCSGFRAGHCPKKNTRDLTQKAHLVR